MPRFVSHAIVGDLANYISDWMPTLCVAFGWRLEHLSVRPEYLQWVVNVQPNTSPGHLMRIMRQQSSEKIFSEIVGWVVAMFLNYLFLEITILTNFLTECFLIKM